MAEVENAQPDFQSALYGCYEALHTASAGFLGAQVNANLVADQNKGALAGELIISDSLKGAAAILPPAALLAGACFLGVDSDPEAAKQLLRHGLCDFVVNTLDEALRILKNELRQKAAVAVCLTADVAAVFSEMVERGLAPNLLFHAASADAPGLQDSVQQLLATGIAVYPVPDAFLDNNPELITWTLPRGNATMLSRVDAIALAIFPRDDRKRRRWLEASRYIPRQVPPSRVCAMTAAELERFVDAVAGRVMSGEISGPVIVTTQQRSITVGGEARN